MVFTRANWLRPSLSPIPTQTTQTIPQNNQQEENGESEDLEKLYNNIHSIPNYSSKLNIFLQQHLNSSIHKRISKKRYPTRRVVTYFPFQVMQADLIEYTSTGFQHNNSGYQYILIMIDCFSKMAYARPLKNKNSIQTAQAFNDILGEFLNIPNTIVTDEGNEFYNREVFQVFQKYGIHHYSIRSKHKAQTVERLIGTIKNRMERYLYKNKSKRWLDFLPQLIKNYNSTPHRTIGMPPNHVTDKNRDIVFKRMYPHIRDHIIPRLQTGNCVRILKQKGIFEKGYKANWTEQIYKIASSHQRNLIEWYKIKDQQGNIIPGIKYYWQLNLVSKKC